MFLQALNEIFSAQVFIGDFDSLYFNLKRVHVTFGICDSKLFEEQGEKNCSEQRTVFLNAFDSTYDSSEFCLSYVLTFVDFHNGTAGVYST